MTKLAYNLFINPKYGWIRYLIGLVIVGVIYWFSSDYLNRQDTWIKWVAIFFMLGIPLAIFDGIKDSWITTNESVMEYAEEKQADDWEENRLANQGRTDFILWVVGMVGLWLFLDFFLDQSHEGQVRGLLAIIGVLLLFILLKLNDLKK
mgnify:CR=1 FL=1